MKLYSIKEDIQNLIYCGTYAPGDKLPSIRAVADLYQCSVTPVSEAYSELVSEGLIESRQRSGYYVSETVRENPELIRNRQFIFKKTERFDLLDEIATGYSGNIVNAGDCIDYPFGATAANIRYYSTRDYYREVAHAAGRAPVGGGNYQTLLNDAPELKREIMKWMLPAVNTVDIAELSIVSSVNMAILLALGAVTEPGDTVAVESPGFTGFYFIAQFLKLNIAPIPTDPQTGLDVAAFIHAVTEEKQKIACLLLCPTYSNPTGAVMPDEEKQRLSRFCAENHIPIIEDDILGEISFEKVRPKSLKCYDPENVIYISGFGKTLSSEIRTAWLAPGKYADAIALKKHLSAAYVNPTLQLGLASYLKSGAANARLQNLREQVSRIMKEQVRIINQHFPLEKEVVPPNGGLYLWIPLKKEIDSFALSGKCAACGISIAPAVTFFAPKEDKNCFRQNCLAVYWDASAKKKLIQMGEIASELYRLVQLKEKK